VKYDVSEVAGLYPVRKGHMADLDELAADIWLEFEKDCGGYEELIHDLRNAWP
jgi:hypothetical protein